MSMFVYPITVEEDTNGTFLVSFPDVPEAHTFGDTLEEALFNADEALEVALSMYIDDWREFPKASRKKARYFANPSLKGEMKFAIYKAMRDQKVRKTDLAKRMGVALMQVDRILDVTHSSRIEQLEAALGALGKRVHVELEAV